MTDAYTTQLELLELLVDTTTPPLFVPSIESCTGPINASFAEGEPITGQVVSSAERDWETSSCTTSVIGRREGPSTGAARAIENNGAGRRR